eukprot:GEMP01059492.1.p1 GENE.GEMP01059492.1~~GEMP01059492.1.p1  ORF type:complete len:350 (+),score=66.83 GEMP01059492.1:127-1050(+)
MMYASARRFCVSTGARLAYRGVRASAARRMAYRSFCTPAVERTGATSSGASPSDYKFKNPRLSAAQLGQAPRIPRKYTKVAVTTLPEGFGVTLDDKPVKTPKGKAFVLPSESLAQKVAEEWIAQEKHIIPDSMPMMTIACTAIDIVGDDAEACVDRLMPFLYTDTICFINDESAEGAWDKSLAKEQARLWTPVRQWFQETYGPVGVSLGLSPPEHPQETIDKVISCLASRNRWELAAMEVSTRYTKSVICATRFLADAVTTEQVMSWALLEENFQIERCGLVEGEHDVLRDDMAKWLQAAKDFRNYF